MAAQLKDHGRQPGVMLVRPKDFQKIEDACKHPPKPSQALIQLFASRRAKS